MKNKIKLIIVDDNKEICDVLTQFFAMTDDIEVCAVANDGADGFEQIMHHKPDIVLLDIIMPEIDGLALLDRLSSQFVPKDKMPIIIVVSAMGLDSITSHALNKGASYYIIKPFDVFSLKEIIHMLYKSKGKPLMLEPNIQESESLKLILRSYLIKAGIHTNVLGYKYLLSAVAVFIEKKGISLMVKDVYKFISEENNTTPQCVERAIRNAIKTAYQYKKPGSCPCFENHSKCPSNSEFISSVAEQIKIIYNL